MSFGWEADYVLCLLAFVNIDIGPHLSSMGKLESLKTISESSQIVPDFLITDN